MQDPHYVDPIDFEEARMAEQRRRQATADSQPGDISASKKRFKRFKLFEYVVVWPLTLYLIWAIGININVADSPESAGAGWALIGVLVIAWWVPFYWLVVLIMWLQEKYTQ